MSATYRKIDWATDRLARTTWDEDSFLSGIDRRMNKRAKRTNKMRKNHRNYV